MDFHSLEENTMLESRLNGDKILIITGRINSGKTAAAGELILRLKASGKKTAGILCRGIFSGTRKTGFYGIDISTGKVFFLASDKPSDRFSLRQGRFYFNEKVLRHLNSLITKSPDNDVILIDEVGPLELRKQGFYSLLRYGLTQFNGKLIFTARRGIINEITRTFNLNREKYDLMEIGRFGRGMEMKFNIK